MSLEVVKVNPTVCVCVFEDSLSLSERKQRDLEERMSLVLWKKPLVTLHYFQRELLITLKDWMWR